MKRHCVDRSYLCILYALFHSNGIRLNSLEPGLMLLAHTTAPHFARSNPGSCLKAMNASRPGRQ